MPDVQPFEGESTYKASYPKKAGNPHPKKATEQPSFPDGYKFDGNTTYKCEYVDKPIIPVQSCKPVEKVGNKGFHDLNSVYRQDFVEKEPVGVCPILQLPKRPVKL